MSIGGGRPLLCSLLFKRVQCLCASECLLGLLLAICCTIGTLRPPWHCLTLSPSFLPPLPFMCSHSSFHWLPLTLICHFLSCRHLSYYKKIAPKVLRGASPTNCARHCFSLLPSPFCPFWARSLASAKQQLHQITLHWRTSPFE